MIEIVKGTIIGTCTTEKPYWFYTLGGEIITGPEWFETDDQAAAWFKRGWPIAYKRGVDMRTTREGWEG